MFKDIQVAKVSKEAKKSRKKSFPIGLSHEIFYDKSTLEGEYCEEGIGTWQRSSRDNVHVRALDPCAL